MDLFLGISDMPIRNFEQALKTNNMSYLVVGWDERKEIEVPEDANERWGEIYNEYCKRTANNEALTFYSLSCEIGYLEMRYTAIYSLISNLCEQYKKEIGLRINKWGLPFNVDGKISDQLPALERHLRIAQQGIGIKKRKLDALKMDEEEEPTSFLKQVIIINEQLGIKIDMKMDSVEYFFAAIERLKEKIQQQKKAS